MTSCSAEVKTCTVNVLYNMDSIFVDAPMFVVLIPIINPL